MRRQFVVALPVLFLTIAIFSYRHPGDEYGHFFVGAMPCWWVLWAIKYLSFGNSPFGILPPFLTAGAMTMTALGYALDRLRSPRIVFAATWLVLTAALVANALRRFPTYANAMSKNGSLEAYVYSAANMSLFGVAILFVVIMAALAIIRRIRQGGPVYA